MAKHTEVKRSKTEAKGAGQPVKDGHLPVSELLFDRPGAASPFGEDVAFPLPLESLTYEHPAR